MTDRKSKIVVDADACPVKDEIEKTGAAFGMEVWMVASFDHSLGERPGVRIVQVDRSSQSADLYISNHIKKNDVLVTQDYGLAAVALGKGAQVISFRGRRFYDQTIDFLLEQRHDSAKWRRGGKHFKGPKPFTNEDRKIFLHTLTKVLRNLQEKG